MKCISKAGNIDPLIYIRFDKIYIGLSLPLGTLPSAKLGSPRTFTQLGYKNTSNK